MSRRFITSRDLPLTPVHIDLDNIDRPMARTRSVRNPGPSHASTRSSKKAETSSKPDRRVPIGFDQRQGTAARTHYTNLGSESSYRLRALDSISPRRLGVFTVALGNQWVVLKRRPGGWLASVGIAKTSSPWNVEAIGFDDHGKYKKFEMSQSNSNH